jgi:hypothetical protein
MKTLRSAHDERKPELGPVVFEKRANAPVKPVAAVRYVSPTRFSYQLVDSPSEEMMAFFWR